MTTDRALAIAGVLIGIPGFCLLFMSDKWVHGVLLLLVAVALGLWWMYANWRNKQPIFTIIDLKKKLIIHADDGSKATLTRIQKARVNHKGIAEWWCRNLSADGTLTNFLIDGKPPDEILKVSGTTQVCRRFAYPKDRGDIWESVLTYDLENSFMRPREENVHYTGFKIATMSIEIDLPRACKSAELRFTFGGQQPELLNIKPTISPDRRNISVKIKRPRLGGQYHLCFEW
jgi:hypothetical protein